MHSKYPAEQCIDTGRILIARRRGLFDLVLWVEILSFEDQLLNWEKGDRMSDGREGSQKVHNQLKRMKIKIGSALLYPFLRRQGKLEAGVNVHLKLEKKVRRRSGGMSLILTAERNYMKYFKEQYTSNSRRTKRMRWYLGGLDNRSSEQNKRQ
jgi:hypothetical protein